MSIMINNTYLQHCKVGDKSISRIQVGSNVVWTNYHHIIIYLPEITEDGLFTFKLGIYDRNKNYLYSEIIESDIELDLPYDGYVTFEEYNKCSFHNWCGIENYPVFGDVFTLRFKNLYNNPYIKVTEIPQIFDLKDYIYNDFAFDIKPGHNNFPLTWGGNETYYYRLIYYVNDALRCIATGDNWECGVEAGMSDSNCGQGRYTIKYGDTFSLGKLYVCPTVDNFVENCTIYEPGPASSYTYTNFYFHSLHENKKVFDHTCRDFTDSWLSLGVVEDA